MANKLLNPVVIAREVLRHMKNNLVMGALVLRVYEHYFVDKIGDEVTIKKPVKYDVGDGDDVTNTVQDIVQQSIKIKIEHRKHIAYRLSGKELTLDIKRYGEEFAAPAGEKLAQYYDWSLCGLYNELFYHAGTAGQTPDSFKHLAAVSQILDEIGVPVNNRRLVLNPAANWSMADSLKGLFQTDMVRRMVEKGKLTTIAGLDIYTSQNVRRHVWTPFSTNTPLIDGTVVNDTSTLYINGFVGTLNVGDILTVDGVYAVNNQNNETLPWLHPFVVTEKVVATNALTTYAVKVGPELVVGTGTLSRAYQNISAYPVNDAAVSVIGTHAANMAFHKNCFAGVSVPVAIPESCTYGGRATYSGLSVRVVKWYDGNKDKEYIRYDIMFGKKAVYPELGARLIG